MMRWLALMAVIAGVLAGMALPRPAAGNLTNHQLAVTINPPTLASGSSPTLTCGWHTACSNPPSAGIALDWDDENGNTGNPWHFRGYFYVSDANRTAFKMFPLVSQSGPGICDIMTVWITERHSGQLMAMPTFTHVNITSSTAFSWMGGPWTIYNSRQIGTTIDENDVNCSTGSHVHQSHVGWLPDKVATTTNTPLYPDGPTVCPANDPNATCGTFQNNNINYWIRRFAWAEGACQHAPGPC